MQVLANFEEKVFLTTDKFSIGFKQIQCTIHEVKQQAGIMVISMQSTKVKQISFQNSQICLLSQQKSNKTVHVW